MNKFILLFFTYLLSLDAKAATNDLNRMEDIPIIYNLDSMESQIPLLRNNPKKLLQHLIVLEFSRYDLMSVYGGKYIFTIDSLSKILHSDFGKSFVYYYYSKDIADKTDNLKTMLMYADSALMAFEKRKDTTGILLTNISLLKKSSLNLDKVYINNGHSDYTINLNKTVKQIFKKQREKILKRTLDILRKKNDPIYIMKWNLINIKLSLSGQPLFKKGLAISEIRNTLEKEIKYINTKPEYKHLLYGLYMLYGHTFDKEGNMKLKISYYKKAVTCFLHKESLANVSIYSNIANTYQKMDEPAARDSTIHYAKLAIETDKNFKQLDKSYANDYMLTKTYNILAKEYYRKKDYQTAFEYVNQMNEILVKMNKDALVTANSTYYEYELIREQEVKKLELEAKQTKTKQQLWFGAILLIIITLAMVAILRNNYKLKQAKLDIEQLQHTREKFYSIISHDLRSPIEAYQGLASSIGFLLKQGKYEQIYQIAERIDSMGIKLKNLLNNLLEWSKEQQNFISIQKSQIEVRYMIESILDIYTSIIVEKQLIIENKIESSLTLFTDKNLIHTILRNAIDNSFKNSPKNTTITIESKKTSNHIEISISNTAFLSEEQIKNIQELFSTHNNWQPGEKGLGLGLILIRDFSIKLGLKVEVSRNDNEFCINLISSSTFRK